MEFIIRPSCILLIIIIIIQTTTEIFASSDSSSSSSNSTFRDPGKPLYLTKYIPHRIREGQRLAKVHMPELKKLKVKSYSGFFTVDEQYNSNLFFWYFPAKVNPKNAPVVLWLNGGPGNPSLIGLFREVGPFQVSPGGQELTAREYSWSKNHHMIFIDNPVGTGFSFTDYDAGYANNQIDVGKNLLSAMQQFFQLFPNLQSHEFYITGESYAGKYIPALGYAILHSKSEPKINLQGLAIGNGFCDPANQLIYGDYLYQLGFIDWHGKAKFDAVEKRITDCLQKKNFTCAFYQYAPIFEPVDGKTKPLYQSLTGLVSYYNYMQNIPGTPYIPLETPDMLTYILANDSRKALNVGDKPFKHTIKTVMPVISHFIDDYMRSVADWISELLSHYRMYFYTGQVDIIFPFSSTDNYLSKLCFDSADEFSVAKRSVWKVGKYVAGYVKKAGNLTQVTIRNAGHMVPRTQPEWAYNMLLRLTYKTGF